MKSFPELLLSYKSLLTGLWTTDLSNTSAFIYEEISDLNWVGFYLLKNQTLYLGPFQGKIACTEILVGKGVCGTCALNKQSICVPDVHQFAGHIACDSRSNSELVIPMIVENNLVGVLDIDSPKLNRFTKEDQMFFEDLVKMLLSTAKPISLF